MWKRTRPGHIGDPIRGLKVMVVRIFPLLALILLLDPDIA